jgi:hypothetical protein
LVFQKACDYALSNHPDKLVPFDHKLHLDVDSVGEELACEDCHGYYSNGRFKGIPAIGDCQGCHELNEFNKYGNFKESDKPWGSHAKQPDHVFFSHKVVMTATNEDGTPKARCTSCHGDKANSTSTGVIEGKMPMGQCEDCHDSLKISNKCMVCHD